MVEQRTILSPPQARGPQRLLVFLPPRRDWVRGTLGAATSLRILRVRSDGVSEEDGSTISRLAGGRPVELVFDALDVFVAQVQTPRLSEARLRQALPNLLEERVLADPADYHFAWQPAAGASKSDTTLALSVAAIDRSTLARALEAFAQAQVPVRAAYSQMALVPAPRGGDFAVIVAQDRALLRLGPDAACSFELDGGASTALGLAQAQQGLQRLQVYGPAAAIAAAAAPLGIAVESASAAIDADALASALNLLQGSFATSTGYGAAGRLLARVRRTGSWKAPALWAAVCALILVGGLNAYWWKLDQQYQAVRASMRHTFQDAFADEPTIVDPLAQARRAVLALRVRAGLASADDFSVLNAQALRLFAELPMGIVERIEYAEGKLIVRCRSATLDNPALRNTLQARATSAGLALRFEGETAVQLAPAGG